MTPQWLIIDGNPLRQFYADVGALQHMDPQAARHAILQRVGALRADVDGQDGSIVFELSNGSAEASQLLAAHPPIGAQARLMSPAGEVFAGIVSEVQLASGRATIAVTS